MAAVSADHNGDAAADNPACDHGAAHAREDCAGPVLEDCRVAEADLDSVPEDWQALVREGYAAPALED